MNSKTLEVPEKPIQEPSNIHNKFQFSGVKACDKCGAVFLSETLLTEHINKYHAESSEIECDDYEPRKKVSNKKRQLHCALEENTDCLFQCETKDQLKIHVEQKHRSKNQLLCVVCNIFFRDLEGLSIHMDMTHKETDEFILQFKCRSCQKEFNSKDELDKHIIDNHKSHKPCKNCATNNCEYKSEECRFDHTILQHGEVVCFKCGKKFLQKSLLLNHIKSSHDDPCLKYLEGNCTYGRRCVYKHIDINVQNVAKKQNFQTPQVNSHQDFPSLPTRENRLVGIENKMTQIMNQMERIMTRMELMENMIKNN